VSWGGVPGTVYELTTVLYTVPGTPGYSGIGNKEPAAEIAVFGQ
jgi:hypothetical protein